MSVLRRLTWSGLAAVALVVSATPAQAQGKDKHYVISSDRAVRVTRTVLVRRGYTIVRVERVRWLTHLSNGDALVLLVGPLSDMIPSTKRSRIRNPLIPPVDPPGLPWQELFGQPI